MSTPARRRLMRDFKRLQEDPPTGVSGAPSENNIMLWNAVIFGPVGTPFEDELHFSFNLIQPANVKFGVDNWKNGAEYKKHTVVYTQNTWKKMIPPDHLHSTLDEPRWCFHSLKTKDRCWQTVSQKLEN
ncbi:hypothetical protein ILYODFUR_016148 [Ilyodon furcidens]|uniref:UBC core domain-containing protein n=1 Tax=Ilyodon furcidens TaxID=33524 RepID=A0ABV0TWN1_9TELE